MKHRVAAGLVALIGASALLLASASAAPANDGGGGGSVESGKDQSTPVHGGSQQDRGNGKESEQPEQGKGQQRTVGTAPPAANPVGAMARFTG